MWIARGAIYGLQASPAAWGRHRDSELQKIELRYQEANYRLEQARGDNSIWILREQIPDNPAAQLDSPPAATLGVYVDDLLACGPRPLVQALLDEIANQWTISNPKFSDEAGGFTFCGIQIEQTHEGIEIHQKSYIEALLEKYPDLQGAASQPLLKQPEESWTQDGEATLEKLRLGQKLVGEILWVSTRARPDIAYAASRLGQMLVKDINYTLAAGYELLKYLRGTLHYKIVYGAPRPNRESVGPWQVLATNFLELFADASFCAGTDRSQSGVILRWNDAPVAWLSLRQPTASLSTAEAELQAGIDCMTLAEGFTELLRELEGAPLKCVLYGDNQGAITVLQLPQGAWRTRHLRLKASWFLQQVEESKYPVYHVPGQCMLGDICTKTLTGVRVKELLRLMELIVDAEGESRAIGIKNLSADSGGVPIKSGGVAPSESTSGLRNLGADSGGASAIDHELIGTSLDEHTGEGANSNPGIPSLNLLRRALRLLIGAACLKRSSGKVVITVDDPEPEGTSIAWLVALLALLGVVLLCCGVLTGRCGGLCQVESPRIQSMRAEDSDGSDDWTVLSSTGLGRRDRNIRTPNPPSSTPRPPDTLTHRDVQVGRDQHQGLRRRTRRADSSTDPVPQFPRTYLSPPSDSIGNQGTPQAQILSKNHQGPPTVVDPTLETPRYLTPDPNTGTLSGAALGSAASLGFETSERGPSRSNPITPGLSGSRAVAESIPAPEVATVRQGDIVIGAVASYIDDIGYHGLPDGAPKNSDAEELERHTSEEDGVARSHLITDGVDPVIVPEERADVGEVTFQGGREPLRLCIYPGWVFRVPPREFWPRQPDWGGYEALWHQSIPRNVLRDFYHVDYTRMVLIRMHAAPRRRMFLPVASTLPAGLRWENLSGRRRTFVKYAEPTLHMIQEDRITDPDPQRQRARRWTGRTELEICNLRV